jgi:hypothetical protein
MNKTYQLLCSSSTDTLMARVSTDLMYGSTKHCTVYCLFVCLFVCLLALGLPLGGIMLTNCSDSQLQR